MTEWQCTCGATGCPDACYYAAKSRDATCAALSKRDEQQREALKASYIQGPRNRHEKRKAQSMKRRAGRA